MLLWIGLVFLRIGWAVIPQTGYIHPDEFFQTVEVMAGDALDISIERTWEFNESSPVRSIVIPKLLFHPAFRLLKLMSDNIQEFQITARKMICSSRLVMTALSLCVDLCIYNICLHLKLQSQQALLLLASSYVMLTYLTHSFSNSIEAVLLSAVILLIVRSGGCYLLPRKSEKVTKNEKNKHIYKTDKQSSDCSDSETDVLSDSYGMLSKLHSSAYDLHRRNRKQLEEVTNVLDRDIKIPENKNILEQSNAKGDNQISNNIPILTCALLAIINTAGIFNRPTFVLFSFLPLLWWMSCFWRNISVLISRLTVFILSSIVTTVIFCITDTLYYNNLALVDLTSCDKWLTNIIFTPWNFVVYNTNVSNLALHGIHPFYLHLLVYMPLLFGPFMLFVYKGIFVAFKNIFIAVFQQQKKKTSFEDTGLQSFSTVIVGFIFTPVVCFSVIPHQEPRFLIPLLPLVILYMALTSEHFSQWFCSVFLVFNITLSIFYGILHQGGLIPCLIRLEELSSREKDISSVSVLFSHTYMPPKHPLLIGQKSNIEIYDFKGSSLNEIHNKVFELKMSSLSQKSKLSSRVYMVIPGTVLMKFRKEYARKMKLKTINIFFPHLSMEDPPLLVQGDSWTSRKNSLSLFLLEIEMG